MATVNPIDGIKYGFRLLGYGVAVLVLGGIVFGIGGMIARNSPIIGGIIAIVGSLILVAGFLGLQYKVIADGVKAGIKDAGVAMGGGTASQPQGQQQYQGGQGQQYQGGQQGGNQY